MKSLYILILAVALAGCRATEIVREIPVEVPIYHTTATHDTIREYHHTTATTSGDTIFLTERHDYHYITERATHDSVSVPVYLHDTITITKPCGDSPKWPLWPLWVALGGFVAIILALYYAIRRMAK